MTFTIKVRGAGGQVLADFRCPVHGVFESLADRDADAASCPAIDSEPDGQFLCGEMSPWAPSPVFGKMQEVSATQGKASAKPHPMSMDLREVGEGRSVTDWRKERRQQWRAIDYKRRKDEGRIP